MQKIIRNSARCKECGDHIESKYRHDFNMCKCKSIAVDGGLVYIRRSGNIDKIEDTSMWEETNE